MRPVLFEVGGFEVKSYGVFVALAFVAAWLVLRHELGRRAGRAEVAGALSMAAAVGGLVGARAYWYLEHAGSASPGDAFSAAGFTWYGGVVGGALAVLAVAWRLRVRPADLFAAAAPALALGYALGRIACQFAGDGTYGRPSDLPWAMAYPHGEMPTTERVHPTPVYETVGGLMIFALLWRLRDRLSPRRLFAMYLLVSGGERFVVEFIRRNDPVLAGLTQPQLFAGALAGAGCLLLVWRTRPGLSGARLNAG